MKLKIIINFLNHLLLPGLYINILKTEKILPNILDVRYQRKRWMKNLQHPTHLTKHKTWWNVRAGVAYIRTYTSCTLFACVSWKYNARVCVCVCDMCVCTRSIHVWFWPRESFGTRPMTVNINAPINADRSPAKRTRTIRRARERGSFSLSLSFFLCGHRAWNIRRLTGQPIIGTRAKLCVECGG